MVVILSFLGVIGLFLGFVGLAILGARIAGTRRRKAGEIRIRPGEHVVAGAASFMIGLIAFALTGGLAVVLLPGHDETLNAGTIFALLIGASCFVMVYAFVLSTIADWMQDGEEPTNTNAHARAKRDGRLTERSARSRPD